MRQQVFIAFLVGLVLSVHCSENKVLVLLQESSASSNFTTFFNTLSSSGYELDIKGYRDSSIQLKEFDTWLYDHLILFTPKAEGFGGGIDSSVILEFIDTGHNVLMAVGSDISETMRNLAAECGVDFDEKSTRVHDHFQYTVLDETPDHTIFATSNILNSTTIIGKDIKAPVIFKGIGSRITPESDLTVVALSAPETAYSHDPRKSIQEPPTLLTGSGIALVTLVQARNNARVLISGSLDLFSNKLFESPVKLASGKEYPLSGNKEFCVNTALWTFQGKAVLKATNLRHHLLGSSEEPTLYRVNDEVEFLIDILEYNGGKAQPFKADDVQVEFVMLDPYVRLPLTHDGQGTFRVAFKVPDVYGVFKYVINYRHLGYSYIQLQKQVPVRPFKHNEYERFLVCAYPYYASALSTMGAFFALGFFYLYTK